MSRATRLCVALGALGLTACVADQPSLDNLANLGIRSITTDRISPHDCGFAEEADVQVVNTSDVPIQAAPISFVTIQRPDSPDLIDVEDQRVYPYHRDGDGRVVDDFTAIAAHDRLVFPGQAWQSFGPYEERDIDATAVLPDGTVVTNDLFDVTVMASGDEIDVSIPASIEISATQRCVDPYGGQVESNTVAASFDAKTALATTALDGAVGCDPMTTKLSGEQVTATVRNDGASAATAWLAAPSTASIFGTWGEKASLVTAYSVPTVIPAGLAVKVTLAGQFDFTSLSLVANPIDTQGTPPTGLSFTVDVDECWSKF